MVVSDSVIAERFYSLVQPDPNYCNYHNMLVCGLTAEYTDNGKVYSMFKEIESLIERVLLVACNKVLMKDGLKLCSTDYTDYEFYYTLAAVRRQLKHFPIINCILQPKIVAIS